VSRRRDFVLQYSDLMPTEWTVIFVNGRCTACGGTGMKVVHRQGDPVPGCEQSAWSRTVYCGTLYETCDCMKFQSHTVPPFRPGSTGFLAL